MLKEEKSSIDLLLVAKKWSMKVMDELTVLQWPTWAPLSLTCSWMGGLQSTHLTWRPAELITNAFPHC